MKKKIVFHGFSSVVGLTALLLGEKNIYSHFNWTGKPNKFEDLPPISNPLVNYKIQKLEEQFIEPSILKKVQFITGYDYRWYNGDRKLTRKLEGKYKYPIYAIDNRLRYQQFYNQLKNNAYINLEEDIVLDTNDFDINIIGKGAIYSSLFKDNKALPSNKFLIINDLFYFNLECDKTLLQRYNNGTALVIDNFGYVFIYPSLHINGNNTLTIVGCTNYFKSNEFNSLKIFRELKDVLLQYDKTIYDDLSDCQLINENYFPIALKPYFKVPINERKQIGLGNAILRTDPITAKGYNAGVDIALELIKSLETFIENDDENLFYSSFIEKSSYILEQLYHLNLAFSQGTYYDSINPIFEEATKNSKLRDLIIAETFEDIDMYFPWLIDYKEGIRLMSSL